MSLTLLEIAENGQAITWEAGQEGILNEAFQIISERLEGLPNDTFMQKIVAILEQTSTVYRYAYTIPADELHEVNA